MLIDSLSWLSLALGSFCCVSGGIGIFRFPEFFTRMHAHGVTDTLGAILILFGLILQAGFTLLSLKLLLIFLFLLLTGPVSSHAVAKAALHSGLRPINDLFNHPKRTESKAKDEFHGGDVSSR